MMVYIPRPEQTAGMMSQVSLLSNTIFTAFVMLALSRTGYATVSRAREFRVDSQ